MLTVGGGTGKVDIGTVDPVYSIGGEKFATYMAGMVGVKEEVTGNISTSQYIPGVGYKTTIDFKTLERGSDLWLFSKATDIQDNIDKMVVLLTPADNTRTWYEIDRGQFAISIYSTRPTNISYRLTAPRFDYAQWTNYNDNPEASGFQIDDNGTLVANGEPIGESGENLADLSLETAPTRPSFFDSVNLPVYELKDAAGNIIEEISRVSDFMAANIKAGAIETKELVVQGTAFIADTIKAGTVEAGKITSDSLTAFTASVDNVLISSGLVSPSIQTQLISPVPGEADITVKIGEEDSGYGQLNVENTLGEEVASIDTSGNATFSGTLESQEVKTNEVVAGKIYADEIVARNGYFGKQIPLRFRE